MVTVRGVNPQNAPPTTGREIPSNVPRYINALAITFFDQPGGDYNRGVALGTQRVCRCFSFDQIFGSMHDFDVQAGVVIFG
jgi:hypothetical protein